MTTGLLGPKGQPISSKDFAPQAKKASPPAVGERYGKWAGEDTNLNILALPGGGTLGINPSQLTLADFRMMRGNYQINSSLSVLTFMMHQMTWHIECKDKRIEEHVAANLYDVWSRLVRAQAQALWAGYSPNVLQWENDINGRAIKLTKIKDLIPEDCRVHWKKIQNVVPNTKGAKATFSVYDGIKQWGALDHIPVENSYWYPMLMENGNYDGRRILESAFQPWFFSTLLHLFANRYYERFGEPVPVGRAPYEEEIDVGGTRMRGNRLMAMILNSIRNRSTVILPNDKSPFGDENNPDYDYQIEYLESQMRGADFERYMTRLDEEMSLAMFTPILMVRTADVGSYNLGTQHTQVYKWMLNAISGDWADYINKYILRPMVAFNFSPYAPEAKIKFTQLGKASEEFLKTIVSDMIGKDKIKPDIRELGEMTGMNFSEIRTVTQQDDQPEPEEPATKPDEEEKNEVLGLILDRVTKQVNKAFREKTFGTLDFVLSFGYNQRLADTFKRAGLSGADERVSDIYDLMSNWSERVVSLGIEEFGTAEMFMKLFKSKFENAVEIFTR